MRSASASADETDTERCEPAISQEYSTPVRLTTAARAARRELVAASEAVADVSVVAVVVLPGTRRTVRPISRYVP